MKLTILSQFEAMKKCRGSRIPSSKTIASLKDKINRQARQSFRQVARMELLNWQMDF